MLTRTEAKELVISRLKAAQEARDVFIADDRTSEHEFGWLFYLTLSDASTTESRLIIVNKHVAQVVGSSIHYRPERFVEVYERLLAMSRRSAANWCLTSPGPVLWSNFLRWRIARKTKAMGLYQIR